MNIHQIFGKIINLPILQEQRGKKCYGFTFLYYSLSPFTKEAQANFVQVELPVEILQNQNLKNLKGYKFLLSGYFYQKRWQDSKGVFHSHFHFYAHHLQPLQITSNSFLVA